MLKKAHKSALGTQQNVSEQEDTEQESDAEQQQLEEESDNEEEQLEADNDNEEEQLQQENDNDNENEYDLDAESTSSSDASFDEDEENDDNAATELNKNTLSQKIKERCDKNRGKKLHIRFGAKLTADDEKLLEQAKNLSALITEVHRPRQKYARFCFVDFASQTDRDAALKDIRKAIRHKEPGYKGVVVNIPRTESDEFVDKIIKKKITNLEAKKTKSRLKRAAIVAKRSAQYTTTVIVTNLPQRSSTLELRTAFPNAIDMQIKRGKAAITLPSTFEARKVYKNPPLMSGIALKLRFHINRKNKRTGKQQKAKKEPTDAAEQQQELTSKVQAAEEETSEKVQVSAVKKQKRKLTQASEAEQEKRPKLEKKLKSKDNTKQKKSIKENEKPVMEKKLKQKTAIAKETKIITAKGK